MQASAIEIPFELISLLRGTSKLVALTGAGVSQESGLRTFRDAQTGFGRNISLKSWLPLKPLPRPKLIWDWYAWRREAVKGVRPNPGHYALVEMERRAPEFTLITQNVDGLHRMAGNQNVLELHGNIQRVRCADCYTVTETWEDDTELSAAMPGLWRIAQTGCCLVWGGVAARSTRSGSCSCTLM